MNRDEKQAAVADLKDLFGAGEVIVVTHYAGLDADAMTELRRRVREAGSGFRVAKNRLAKRALEGTPHEGLADLFSGPTAIAYGSDPVSTARALRDFSEDYKNLVVLGGGIAERRLSAADVATYATLPSLEVLRGKLVGLIAAPAQRMASVLQAPAGALARVTGAYGDTAGS